MLYVACFSVRCMQSCSKPGYAVGKASHIEGFILRYRHVNPKSKIELSHTQSPILQS